MVLGVKFRTEGEVEFLVKSLEFRGQGFGYMC
jgi:hypothetical protein